MGPIDLDSMEGPLYPGQWSRKNLSLPSTGLWSTSSNQVRPSLLQPGQAKPMWGAMLGTLTVTVASPTISPLSCTTSWPQQLTIRSVDAGP